MNTIELITIDILDLQGEHFFITAKTRDISIELFKYRRTSIFIVIFAE